MPFSYLKGPFIKIIPKGKKRDAVFLLYVCERGTFYFGGRYMKRLHFLSKNLKWYMQV